MIVCRPYIQTKVYNILIGVIIPVCASMYLARIISDPTGHQKIYYYLSLPFLIIPGVYFLFFRCIWALKCDEEKKTLSFTKTLRNRTFSIRHIDEIVVFKMFRIFYQGYDFYFKIARFTFSFEEMDNMPDLITFLKKTNPQIDIRSPEDHKYF
jgi:hypothetical protein